jgi:hypothetical protein
MKLGDLVKYTGRKHYTIDRVGRVGIVIKADKVNHRLKTRKVLFGGEFICNMKIYDLEAVSE